MTNFLAKIKNIHFPNWKKYALEFLSIFIAVFSAFALSNWNENKNTQLSEQKILTEIKNGIALDTKDFNNNVRGHKLSIRSTQLFRDLISNKPVAQDSIPIFYIALFRDYTALINGSGYESLKESGLKTITNDSLRLKIITLYDYYYGIIDVIDNINEMQSFKNYYQPINEVLHPYMKFNVSGELTHIENPTEISDKQRKELLSYLWRLEKNRNYKIQRNNMILDIMQDVSTNITKELDN